MTDIAPLLLRKGHSTSSLSCLPSSPVDLCHHVSSVSWVAPNYRAISAHSIRSHKFRAVLGLQECFVFISKSSVMFFEILTVVLQSLTQWVEPSEIMDQQSYATWLIQTCNSHRRPDCHGGWLLGYSLHTGWRGLGNPSQPQPLQFAFRKWYMWPIRKTSKRPWIDMWRYTPDKQENVFRPVSFV